MIVSCAILLSEQKRKERLPTFWSKRNARFVVINGKLLNVLESRPKEFSVHWKPTTGFYDILC
jgi:hypothetical protein